MRPNITTYIHIHIYMLDYINRIFTCSRKRTQQQEVDVGHRRMLLDVLSGILNGRSLCHNALRLQQQELNCAKISHRPRSDAGIVPASNIKVGFFKSGQVHSQISSKLPTVSPQPQAITHLCLLSGQPSHPSTLHPQDVKPSTQSPHPVGDSSGAPIHWEINNPGGRNPLRNLPCHEDSLNSLKFEFPTGNVKTIQFCRLTSIPLSHYPTVSAVETNPMRMKCCR